MQALASASPALAHHGGGHAVVNHAVNAGMLSPDTGSVAAAGVIRAELTAGACQPDSTAPAAGCQTAGKARPPSLVSSMPIRNRRLSALGAAAGALRADRLQDALRRGSTGGHRQARDAWQGQPPHWCPACWWKADSLSALAAAAGALRTGATAATRQHRRPQAGITRRWRTCPPPARQRAAPQARPGHAWTRRSPARGAAGSAAQLSGTPRAPWLGRARPADAHWRDNAAVCQRAGLRKWRHARRLAHLHGVLWRSFALCPASLQRCAAP